MDGSTAYSLTQWSTRISTRGAAVCLVMRRLARQVMCRVVPYKISLSLLRRYAILSLSIHTLSLSTLQLRSPDLTIKEPFPENSSDGRSYSFCVAARALIRCCPVPAIRTVASPPRESILDFPYIISLPHNPTNRYNILGVGCCAPTWLGRHTCP